MLTTVQEVKMGNERKFIVALHDSDGNLISSRECWASIKKVQIEKKNYYLLFDYEGHNIEEVFKYINFHMEGAADNYKYTLTKLLKQLYEFSFILNKSLRFFAHSDFLKLSEFLAGGKESTDLTMSTSNFKSQEIIIKCLSCYKQFLRFNRYDNWKQVDSQIAKASVLNRQNNTECPKFISQADMKRIHAYVINDNLIDEETRLKYDALYRLLYSTGLRIGEALGLTLQDLKTSYVDGDYIYYLIIRNRLSDNKNQKAKTCMNIASENDYLNPSYSIRGFGFQTVGVPKSVYLDILKYFDAVSFRTHRERKKMPFADDAEHSHEDNFYIFQNRYKTTPLSVDVLRKYTRQMFIKLGIPVDDNIRSSNLLHRFRHGFCMYLLYVADMPAAKAITFTRHTSIEGLAPYINPTEEMIIDILEEATEGIDNYE